ncbi:MAG: cadherin-like domain-containing protein, partial [Gammaproteobacteria bacterium]|nr:cadherin-like domain-containing protein [Gammaproteobacteria bacterium]
SKTATGAITVDAKDGLVSVTVGTETLDLDALTALSSTTPVTITTDYVELTLTGFTPEVVNGITVGGKLSYSYELTKPFANAEPGQAGDENGLDKIELKVVDAGNAESNGTLDINIIDDVPHIDTTTHEPMLEVDETTLGSAATEDFAGIFTPSYGADGKGVADKYTLIVNAGADSGLVDTATGTAIKLYIAADGSIEGRVGAEDGDVAFKLSVNANGKVTLTQNSAVKHPNSKDPDDKVSLKDSGIKLELKITDTDGDTATESADIGKFIGFKDDGPTLNTAQVDGDGFVIGNVIVDEKYLPTGSASDAARLTVIKELPINFGADGAVNAANETGLIFANTDALEALKLKSGTTELTYQISGDGHTITATAGGKNIFTITLSVDVNGKASYEFTLKGPLAHTLENDIAANIKLPFDITATDGDGDSVDLKFKVEVVDDTPKNEVRELTVDEDGAVSFSNADINNSTTKITSDVKHGTVTIGNDGKITYTPNEDYRGSDSYTYTVTTASGTYERTVNITVKPVADAPLFADRTDGGVVVTPEDTEKSLGLKLPAIKDIGATGQNDPGYSGTDYSELLGAITLTPSGAGYIAGDTKFTTKVNGAGAEIELKPVGGKITIVITDTSGGATPSDGYHVKGDIVPTKDESNGVYYLTKEEYEAITAHPAADRHENFKVEVSVDSYEVDADGKKLTDVNGANSKQTITVDVQAVTDEVVLNVKEDTTQNGVTVVISDANKTADITFDEDTSFNLTNILAPAAFKDLDGSETRYLGLKGLSNGTTVTVDGVDYVIGQAGTPTVDFGGATGVVPAITIAGTVTGLPSITITPPKDFSGDLTGIKVVLGAQDSD